MSSKESDSEINSLLEDPTSPKLSAEKQRAMLVTILLLQFFATTFETCGYPFYPEIATNKGLSSSEIGLAFAAYGAASFMSAPIAGSMVSP